MRKILTVLWIALLCCLVVSPVEAGRTEIRILHVNDFHGFAEPHQPLGSSEMVGGIAYLAARAKELRREKPSLLLAAGDMIQGNNWANLFQGESVIRVMNGMRFDAMVVGNHEFDFGQDVLRTRISEAQFPVLGANVEWLEGLKPYVVLELGGLKVAVIGVVTEDTPVSTHPRNVVGLKFQSPQETLKRWVAALQGTSDVIIALSHCGYPADRKLAENVPGIHVIVGGHSHTKLAEPAVVGNTVIVQAWEHGKVLGVLDLTWEEGRLMKWEGRLEEVRPEPGEVDQPVQTIVEEYEGRLDAALSQKVGEALCDLDGEHVRQRETNFGDLIADIMRDTSGADATIINGGGIRTSIRRGEVLVKHVYSALPFDNYIVAIQLTGREIREALEHGVSGVERGEGRFPQVSGLSFSYRPSAPEGSRVQEVRVAGQPLDADREYVVGTNDFLAAGGDGYRAFGDAITRSKDFAIVGGMMKGERLRYSDAGRWLRDVVIDSIREKGSLCPGVEGRIAELP